MAEADGQASDLRERPRRDLRACPRRAAARSRGRDQGRAGGGGGYLMGLRGPAPKPTGVRVLEGCRAHRPLPENEPQYPPGTPAKPKKISRQAQRVWEELVDEMAPANVLRSVDQRALWQLAEDEALLSEAYAGLWKMIRAVEDKARKEGKELPGGPLFALVSMTSGRLAMNAIRDLGARVLIERREFGLTPSSRTRISTAGESSMDALEMKLCG